ncbi:MAG TPA: ATP-dependent helicase [Candidatus Dormibacteraeota bacterium]|nr:ATP-dependent helicase [Candidatus Dormibacteraeota bacterium]
MGQVAVVIGQAGTGKTTWLMGRAKELAPGLVAAEHQRMLVITYMHGARRRLEHKLKDAGRTIPYSIATIDGFALSIVNRWRTALGHTTPVAAVPGDVDFADGVLGIEADFGRVVGSAARLLQSQTVGGIIGATYPLILIDEFQDCHGPRLEFVAALSKQGSVLLAADEFQLLDSTVPGCPAVEWARTQTATGVGTIEELTTCHRTSVTGILAAARCLRDNTPATGRTIPVVCCLNHGPAAWKIIERLVCCAPSDRWTGTCALICPSHDPVLEKVLESCTTQLRKKNLAPIRWQVERSAEEEQGRTATSLGLATATPDSDGSWQTPSGPLDGVATNVLNRVQRFARLRGIDVIPHRLVARHVDMTVHQQRAYWSPSSSRTVTTVHGAKNREFDNVFVLWPYKVPSDVAQRRRLLYNAVTRSRRNCMVLVHGDENRARTDPVLALLGLPEPAFKPNRTLRERTTMRTGR